MGSSAVLLCMCVPLLSVSVSVATQCSGGFEFLGSRCYSVIHKQETWADAQSICHSMGATLAEIYNREEALQVGGLASHEVPHSNDAVYTWLGGSDLTKEGHWFWASGAPIDEFDDWDAGQPDTNGGHDEDCLALRLLSGRWHDVDCDNKFAFVCQKDPQGDGVIG